MNCFIDESGTGDEPLAVMTGIVVDTYRMKPTKDSWEQQFQYLTNELKLNIEELNARDLFQN